jgi:hypothetical protein
MVPVSIFPASSRCARSAFITSVDSNQCGKHTRVFSAEEPLGNFIISGSPDHSRTISVMSHDSWIRLTFPASKVSGTEMDTPIDNGWYKNS